MSNNNKINDLNRFLGRTDSGGLTYGENLPSSTGLVPSTGVAVRSMGFRGPMNVVGWGYDKYGRPVPGHLTHKQAAATGQSPHEMNFLGGKPYPSGGSVPTSGYVAGPVDLRYDPHTSQWTSDHSFLAEIIGYKKFESTVYQNEAPSHSFGYKYAWKPVRLYTSDSNAFYSADTAPFQPFNYSVYPSGGIASDRDPFAINLYELSAEGYAPVPEGTVVELKPRRMFDLESQGHANEKTSLVYTFSFNPVQPIIGRITSWSEASNPDNDNIYYSYVFTQVNFPDTDSYSDIFSENQAGMVDTTPAFSSSAINLCELRTDLPTTLPPAFGTLNPPGDTFFRSPIAVGTTVILFPIRISGVVTPGIGGGDISGSFKYRYYFYASNTIYR